MNDTAIEAVDANALAPNEIRLGKTATTVVFSLAIYGGQDLTRKGVSKTKQILANRKAKRNAKKAAADIPEQ